MKSVQRLFPVLTLLLTGTLILPAQTEADTEAVRQAILHYVDALYEADTAQVYAGVHPALAKRGFWRPEDSPEYKGMSPMSFEQLVALSGKWNAKGWLPVDAPKEIVIFEVQDQTATAKLTAEWGTDYFHLAKFDDGWKIVNVLWQSPPPKAE